ncbi:hypothetical protein D9M72_391930 [compost metagenome]
MAADDAAVRLPIKAEQFTLGGPGCCVKKCGRFGAFLLGRRCECVEPGRQGAGSLMHAGLPVVLLFCQSVCFHGGNGGRAGPGRPPFGFSHRPLGKIEIEPSYRDQVGEVVPAFPAVGEVPKPPFPGGGGVV